MAGPTPESRINDQIRAREVLVIGPNGDKLGVKPMPDALAMARSLELDLVQVAENANPPVCRIMDYGKYKYETAQKLKESKKKASNVVVKEMKYRPKISGGDFDTKTRKVEKFLQEGHKVKITIMFRGREVTHPELGRKILDSIAERVDEYAKVEAYPRLDGRNMTMILGPDSKKKPKKKPTNNQGGDQNGRQQPADGSANPSTAPTAAPDNGAAAQPSTVAAGDESAGA